MNSLCSRVAGVLAWVVASGCGGSAPTPVEPATTEAPVEEEAAAPEGTGSSEAAAPSAPPDTCAPGKADCMPGEAFTQKLCRDVYPDAALYMFRKGTPWQRLYLRGRTEAINASGGATVAGFLEFDEEVLMLRHRAADTKGIQIGSGNGQYDALRWDGSCVSLEGEEVSTQVPSKPKHTRVEWRWLGDPMQDALRADNDLSTTYRARQKECKGVTIGDVSKQCEKLDAQLIQKIVNFVRSNSELPQPSLR